MKKITSAIMLLFIVGLTGAMCYYAAVRVAKDTSILLSTLPAKK